MAIFCVAGSHFLEASDTESCEFCADPQLKNAALRREGMQFRQSLHPYFSGVPMVSRCVTLLIGCRVSTDARHRNDDSACGRSRFFAHAGVELWTTTDSAATESGTRECSCFWGVCVCVAALLRADRPAKIAQMINQVTNQPDDQPVP